MRRTLLLIQPLVGPYNSTSRKGRNGWLPSLTIPLLASLVPSHIEVIAIDENIEDIDFNVDVDIVGITTLTSQATRAYQIAQEFRSRAKTVIMGGFHPTLMPHEAKAYCDSVVIGEAEGILGRLFHDWEHGELQPFYKSRERPDLSKLPVPRYDLLKPDRYFYNWMPVQTTRGCPLRCKFCSVTEFFKGSFRKSTIDRVLRDIKATSSNKIFFVDDNLTIHAKFAKELFRALIPLNINWGGQSNIKFVRDKELLQTAKESGCFFMLTGIDTLNEMTLKSIHKPCNKIEDYKEELQIMREAGIVCHASIIIGFDYDSLETFNRTFDFLMENHVPVIYLNMLTPLPGTEIYAQFKREKRIFENEWRDFFSLEPTFSPAQMSVDDFRGRFMEVYRKCYSFPNIARRLLASPRFSYSQLKRVFRVNMFYRKAIYSNNQIFFSPI